MRISTRGGGGEETNFFFLSRAQEISWRRRGKFVCNSLSLLLMVAPCRGASKRNRNTSTPTSLLRWEMVSLRTGCGSFGAPRKKREKPQRATPPCRVSHRRHFNKVSWGASFQQCSPRTLTCCRPIKLSRSQIQVAFLESDFFFLPSLQYRCSASVAFWKKNRTSTRSFFLLWLALKVKRLGDQVGLIVFVNILRSRFKHDGFSRCFQPLSTYWCRGNLTL